jgi:hypothetical protein
MKPVDQKMVMANASRKVADWTGERLDALRGGSRRRLIVRMIRKNS